jgi:hypothetical protein
MNSMTSHPHVLALGGNFASLGYAQKIGDAPATPPASRCSIARA